MLVEKVVHFASYQCDFGMFYMAYMFANIFVVIVLAIFGFYQGYIPGVCGSNSWAYQDI